MILQTNMQFTIGNSNIIFLKYHIYSTLNIIKKFNFIVLILLIFATSGYAQSYNTAAGLRLGNDFGYSVQQRLGKKQTAELVYITGLLEDSQSLFATFKHHMPLISRRFNMYAGIGLGGRWTFANNEIDEPREFQKLIPIVIGGEFTIGRFNISTDVIPLYILERNREKRMEKIGGISIRYVLIKRKKNGIFKKIVFWK